MTITHPSKKKFSLRRVINECYIRFAEMLRATMDVPQFPQRLPGEIWGLCVSFGEMNEKFRLSNLAEFRARNKKQGLKLLWVEQALPGRDFLLTPRDADILIQILSFGRKKGSSPTVWGGCPASATRLFAWIPTLSS